MSDPYDRYPSEDLWLDRDGNVVERRYVGGEEVIVHYVDIPDCDRTVVRGIPCTTALRAVIDIAPDVTREHLHHIVRDALDRRLFTAQEAWLRIAEPDMAQRVGAHLLRDALPLPGR